MMLDVKKVKIVVMVPEDYTDEIRNAMCNSGAGIIGNYTMCTSKVKSLGTFLPNEDANPFLGSNNNFEKVKEDRLEAICDIENAKKVIKSIKDVHPYEEAEVDIYPLIMEEDL